MSKEYLKAAEAVEKNDGEFIWLEVDDGTQLFPKLPLKETPYNLFPVWSADKDVWAGFPLPDQKSIPVSLHHKSSFLDYNFIYDPLAVARRNGKSFKKFRKNTKRFLRITEGELIYRIKESDTHYHGEVTALLLEWFHARDVSKIADGDTLVRYVMNGLDEGRVQTLIQRTGDKETLLGFNVWDENYHYTNYRYCIARPGVKYLDEYLRLCFYTNLLNKEKKVNDGGCLDSDTLYGFKSSLNPVIIKRIFSYKKEETE